MDAPQGSEDESICQRFFAIMATWECNQAVFKHLRRCHLKRLRLTCRAMDDLVASEAFILFSNVCISTCMKDLIKLEAISLHPRLAKCVRTLHWHTGAAYPNSRKYRHSFQEYENEITGEDLDFRILIQSLARFPRLHVVQVLACDARLKYTWPEHSWQPDPRRDNSVWLPSETEHSQLLEWARQIAEGSINNPPRRVLASIH
ncbi:hypothetical protein BDV19DRAFT_384479 [Aspergillus venezuelensis]